MTKISKTVLMISISLIVLCCQFVLANNSCSKSQLKTQVPKNALWRAEITNKETDISVLYASVEKQFKSRVKEMEEGILVHGYAAEMYPEFIGPEHPVEEIVPVGDYGSGIVGRYGLSGLKESSGKVRAILFLAVSGHNGPENALKWAKMDTYDIALVRADGREEILVRGAPSKGVVTLQEVDIQLKLNEVVTIEYRRSGAAGYSKPSAMGARIYPEQRTFQLIWTKE